MKSPQQIEQAIGQLLYLHDCVVLPEFGGFIARKKSAFFDHESGRLYPTHKQIGFNKQLTADDGLLTHHFALVNACTFDEARNEVSEFVRQLKQRLFNREQVTISRLGILYNDTDFLIQFRQDQSVLFYLPHFGLKAIEVKSIVRDEVEPRKIKNLTQINHQPDAIRLPARPVIWLTKKALQIVPMVAALVFSGLVFINSNHIGSNQMAALGIVSLENAPLSFGLPLTHPKFARFTSFRQVQNQTSVQQEAMVFLIASSHRSIAQAEFEAMRLQDLGFNALVLERSKSGLIRVAYGQYETVESAENELTEIRKGMNEDAYLLVE